jgi:Magnesium chelatase, subunit ChlI
MGLTLADRWQTRSLWQSALRRVCMWRDSRFGGCSIARSRAEALAGQTEMSEAKAAMTLAEAFKTTHIHSIADLTSDRTALVMTRPCRAPHHTLSDAGLIGGRQVPMAGSRHDTNTISRASLS